jgi:glycerol-3-phosphate dehydrogenase
VSEISEYDVVVIGGGINGSGAARDLALRGLKVALVEKRDLGSGATGASSGMIHGGARYLTHEPQITRMSCTDSGAVQRIASHMIFRIPFIFPMLSFGKVEGMPPRVAYHLMDSLLFAYDLYQPLKGGLPHQRLSKAEALELEPGLNHEMVGAVSWDEWGIDAARLCLANALSASESGAEVLTHCQVVGFLRHDGESRIDGVEVLESLTGRKRRLRCRAVLNAAGPWSELVASQAGATVRIRPTKGVHLLLGGRLSNYAISALAVDGRTIFIEPWQDITLIGTTDDDYYGDLDRLEVTFDEVGYLLEAAEAVFPTIREHRVIDTWAGIRPTLHQYGMNEDRVSREHQVFDHRDEGAEGLFTLTGGKLAAYRMMSEEAADAVCRYLGVDAASRTAELPLPGAEGEIEIDRWAANHDIPEAIVRKLARRHGSRTGDLLARERDRRGSAGGVVCRCQQVLAAEVRHAVRREWARTLGDVMRRTRLGTGPCGGLGCAHLAATILAQELGRTPLWAAREALRFLSQRLDARRPALFGVQARAEAIGNAYLATQMGQGLGSVEDDS